MKKNLRVNYNKERNRLRPRHHIEILLFKKILFVGLFDCLQFNLEDCLRAERERI